MVMEEHGVTTPPIAYSAAGRLKQRGLKIYIRLCTNTPAINNIDLNWPATEHPKEACLMGTHTKTHTHACCEIAEVMHSKSP